MTIGHRLTTAGMVLVLLSLPVMVQALRKGRLHRRGPHGRIERRRQPFQFWSSIAASATITLLGAALVTYGLLKG
jgi:hypothetical protein